MTCLGEAARMIRLLQAGHPERSEGPHMRWLSTQSNENARTPSVRSFAVFAAQDDKLERARGSASCLACANHAFCNPDQRNQRNHPRRQESHRPNGPPEASPGCGGGLGESAAEGGRANGLVAEHVPLAVNLDRDVRRRVGLINLRACAVLALHTDVLDFA